MKDKIDILIATYNTHIPYLKDQLDSIINQTYKNIKILISDDNSTKKEVVELLKEYKKKDKRIELFLQEKNIGFVKNFEFLLKKSKSPYIMFSDHDDIWYPNKVEKSIKKLKEENLDMVYCNANQIDKNGKIIREDYFKYKNVPLIKGKNNCLAISRCIGIACSQIITQSVKNKMLPFTKEVMAHDWLAAFIANEGKGIDYIQEPLFGYRIHNTNVFGGRSLTQNLEKWKKENGKTVKSYQKYRNEKVIDKAYLDGAKMCIQYAEVEEDKRYLKNLIKYYNDFKKTKFINLKLGKYIYFLSGKNLLKKEIKEIVIFHFPIIGYLRFILK